MSYKTPITYYGGKQLMLKHILPLIPSHSLYCEPFVGGAAVYFAKEPAPVEIINDKNGELVNFYKVLKSNFDELFKLIDESLHSREQHLFANIVYSYPQFFNNIRRAWAVWFIANQSFASKLDGSWAYARKTNKCATKVQNNKKRFSDLLSQRFESTQIEHRDALKVIASSDCEEAFIYLDPPYVGSNQGHYAGYTDADFKALLEACSKMKGKFLLSSYPNAMLQKYVDANGWTQIKFDKALCVSSTTKKKRKTEVLTLNYTLPD